VERSGSSPFWLEGQPKIEANLRSKIRQVYESTGSRDRTDLATWIRDEFKVDMASHYGGVPIKNPFGKASGQLSLQVSQVQLDADAGLGFVVLKTVIAQDDRGVQTMAEWAIKESRMVVERIHDEASGRDGWTVSWKGRGWWGSLEQYLDLMRESFQIGRTADMLVVPSCKYHLPASDEEDWNAAEYRYTTERFLQAWDESGGRGPLLVEKDFSPTLAGSDRADQQTRILNWLAKVPAMMRSGGGPDRIRVGLKLFNAMFEDAFQIEMLSLVCEAPERDRADFIIYANRLFDPEREFFGKRGIAYGGPALSYRNLGSLTEFRAKQARGECAAKLIPMSATGDIGSGRMAVEYALRGCENFQMHTAFQLPDAAYQLSGGSKSEKALHELLFQPKDGFIVWMHHVAAELDLYRDGVVHLADVAAYHRRDDCKLFRET
jgi:hypothetical protein